jgi:hypothetical protein
MIWGLVAAIWYKVGALWEVGGVGPAVEDMFTVGLAGCIFIWLPAPGVMNGVRFIQVCLLFYKTRRALQDMLGS